MYTQLKIKENTTLNNLTNEQIVTETNKLKNKTKEVGIRLINHCNEIEEIAELTQINLDKQTNCMETITTDLSKLDKKIKESKTLAKQFSSWFSIFRSTEKKTEYIFKEETQEKKKQILPKKKQEQEYSFESDDPANEIAKVLECKIQKIEQYANGYTNTLNKQTSLIEDIDNKISKSECDIQKVSHKIKKF